MAKNSGITKGKSHKEGGIPMEVKSTGQKIEVEGGEGIVNKYAMSNTDTFKFDGKEKTSCEIISDLNQKKGDGVSFECDTVESKKYKYAKGGSLNFDSAETFYEAMEGVIEKGNEFIDKHEYKGDRHGKSKLAVNIKLYDVNYGIDAALDSYQSRRGNFDLEKEEYVKKDLRIDEEWTYKMYNDFLNDQVYFLVEDLLEKYGEVLEEKQIYQVGRMGGWLVFSDNGELNTNVDELENTLNNNFSEDGELVGYDRWGYDMEPVTFTEFKEEGDYDDALYYTKRINLLLDIYKEVAQDIKEAKDGVADSWKAHLDEKVEEHISENKKRFKIFTEDDPDFAKGGRLEGIPWNTVYTDEPFIQLDVDRKIGYIKALVERHNDKMNRYYDLAGEDGEHRSHSATKKIKQQAYNLESHIGGYIDAYNKLHPNQFKGGNITLSDFNLEYAKGGKVEFNGWWDDSEESDRKKDEYSKKYNLKKGTKIYPKDDKVWKANYGKTPYAIIEQFGLRTPNRITLRIGRGTEIISLEDIINNWKVVDDFWGYAKGGRVFDTDKYGEVSVRFAMLDIDRNNLEEGIEIKGDDIEFTEIMGNYDVDDLDIEEVEELLEKYEGNTLYDPDEDDYYTEEYAKGGKIKSPLNVYIQLEKESQYVKKGEDIGIRYIMIGKQDKKGFSGWISDYVGGGEFQDFYFADGEDVEKDLYERKDGDYDNDDSEEEFIKRKGIDFFTEIEKTMEDEGIGWDDNYNPILKKSPPHPDVLAFQMNNSDEERPWLIPINVGNTIFEDESKIKYVKGGSVRGTLKHNEYIYVEELEKLNYVNLEKLQDDLEATDLPLLQYYIKGNISQSELYRVRKIIVNQNATAEIGYFDGIKAVNEDKVWANNMKKEGKTPFQETEISIKVVDRSKNRDKFRKITKELNKIFEKRTAGVQLWKDGEEISEWYAKGGSVRLSDGSFPKTTLVANVIFSRNHKNSKISTTFGDKTEDGLRAMINNDSYSSKEVAKSIFEYNEKNGKIETAFGNKTLEGLTALIQGVRDNSFAKGGRFDGVKPEYKALFKKYLKQEDGNQHTENALMIVKEFGTEKEYERMEEIKNTHEKEGHLPYELYTERYEISQPHYAKMFYAKGGETAKIENYGDLKDELNKLDKAQLKYQVGVQNEDTEEYNPIEKIADLKHGPTLEYKKGGSTSSFSKEDVMTVAQSLKLNPNKEQVKYVLDNMESQADSDPTGNWQTHIEDLLYEQGVNNYAKGGKIVWVGDMPLDIDGREELTEEEAERLAKEWEEKGYDDVIIEDYEKGGKVSRFKAFLIWNNLSDIERSNKISNIYPKLSRLESLEKFRKLTNKDRSDKIESLYSKGGSTYAEGGEITHRVFVSNEMDDDFINELMESEVSELNELVYGRFIRSDAHKIYQLTEKQYKAIISNPSLKDKADLIDVYAEGGLVSKDEMKSDIEKIKESRYFSQPFAIQLYKNGTMQMVTNKDMFYTKSTLKQIEGLNYKYDLEIIEKYEKGQAPKLSEKTIYPIGYKGDEISLKEFFGINYWLYRLTPRGESYAKGGTPEKTYSFKYVIFNDEDEEERGYGKGFGSSEQEAKNNLLTRIEEGLNEGEEVMDVEVIDYAKGGEIEYMDYDELMEVVMEENSSNQNEKLAKEIAKIQGFKYDAVDYADFHLVVRDYLDGSTNKNDDEAREVLIQAFENTGIEYDDDDDEYAKGGRPRKDTDDILTLGELAFKDTMNNEDGHWDSFDFYKHGYNSVRAGSKSNYIGFGEKDHNVKGDDGWYDEELGKYLSNDQEVALMYTDVDSDGYEIAIVEYLKPLKEIKIKNKKK